MAEFTAAATLDVSVDDSQLRQVRRDIERGIGDVSVGVDGGGTGGRGMNLNRERNDLLEDIRDLLRGTGGGGGGGGVAGGGGGGSTNIIPIGGGGLLSRGAGALGTAAGAVGAGGAGLAAAPFAFGALTLGALSQDEQLNERLQRMRDAGVRDIPAGAPGTAGTGVARAGDRTLDRPSWLSDLLGWEPPPLRGPAGATDPEGGDIRLGNIAQANRNRQPPGNAVSTEGGDVRLATVANNQPRVNIQVDARATVQDIQRALQGASIQRQIENAISDQVSGLNPNSPRTFQP